MSKEVDERVVQMQFDNKQFESNVKTSMTTLDKLKQSLNLTGASKGLENVGSAAKKCDMSALGGAVETVRVKFRALEVMGITALANITNSAVNAGKRIISALTIDPIKSGFAEYETQINAVQTILANTSSKGTTLNQVNAALDELNTYADKTIYNFTEMTRNIGTFTAAGVDLDTSVQAIKGIANLAAVSGSTSQQASTAMYQLSQALSSGTVKLMDWNSVVNAGMGGQVFQDALKETARVHDIKIDDMIKKEGSFRETLSKGWLTSKILTETLNKFTGDLSESQLKQLGYTEAQIKEIIKLGNTANDAATKVKTFTQLFDTLKEAAQSGWTQSWEIVVGDFGEAKAFLTEISDKLGKILGDSATVRNNLLSGGLSSGWNQFLGLGISDEAGYIEVVKAVAKEHNKAIGVMLENEEDFASTLNTGWFTADIMAESLERFAAKTRGLSDEQLTELGYTREQITELEKLNMAVKNGNVPLDEFASKIKMASGRENVIQALRNGFEGLSTVVTSVKDAFREVFPAYTADQLYSLTEGIKALSEKFKAFTDENAEKIKAAFKGVFSVLDIGITVVKKLVGGIVRIIKCFSGLGGTLLSGSASLGDWVSSLQKSLKETDAFGKAVDKVVGFLEKVIGKIREFYSSAKEKISSTGFDGLLNALGMIWDFLKKIGDKVAVIGSKIGSAFSDAFRNGDIKAGLDILNTGIFASILIGIKKFVNSFKDATGWIDKIFGKFDDSTKGIKALLDNVRTSLESWQQNLKATMLLKIAGAIAILAVSLLLIALINSSKLTAALEAITVLFAELLGSLALFDKISGVKNANKAVRSMIGLSISIFILASALKMIGGLEFKQMVTGLVGILGLAAIVVAMAKIMSSKTKTVIKGAVQMVIFAAAIKILASACADLSSLSWEELAKGLAGVGVLMAEVAGFLKIAKVGKKSISTAAGIVILSAAIKILASVCKDFSSMTWDQIKVGLISIGALLGELAIFTNLTGNAKHVISTGIALIAIAAAMKIFATVVNDFASIGMDNIKVGLVGMAGALAAIAIAVNLMPKNLIGIGIGLIAVSAAMLILSSALKDMSSMSWNEIGRGLAVLGGSILILAVGLYAMSGSLAGSAALIVAAIALSVLTPVMKSLGSMSWGGIVKGLAAVAGVFAILGIAALVLSPLIPVILALSVAVAIFGVGCVAAGAGILALSSGLTALAVSGAAGAAAFVAMVTSLIGLIPMVIEQIGIGIVAFANAIANSGASIAGAVTTVILAICAAIDTTSPAIVTTIVNLLTLLLNAIVAFVPQLVNAGLSLIAGLLQGIADNLGSIIMAGGSIIIAFIQGIASLANYVVEAGFQIIINFINGLATSIETNAPLLGEAFANLGIAAIKGFVLGIFSFFGTIIEAASSFVGGFVGTVKELLGIHSPSTVMEGLGGNTVDGYVNGIANGAPDANAAMEELLDGMLGEFDSSKFDFSTAGEIPIDSIISGLQSGSPALSATTASVMSEASEAGSSAEWSDAGKAAMNEFKSGINKGGPGVKSAAAAVSIKAIAAIKNYYSSFYEAGTYVATGFVDGIKSKNWYASDAGKNLAKAAYDAARRFLDEQSPSKLFKAVGAYVAQGFALGIENDTDLAAKASENMADTVFTSTQQALSRIAELCSTGIDTQPTIRPVLDLTNLRSGMSSINAAFSRNRALSISAGSADNPNEEIQNGADSIGVNGSITFKQYNYSPKALSRLEIYRQTKNQLSAMKGLVKA